jgi:hypothetical protein
VQWRQNLSRFELRNGQDGEAYLYQFAGALQFMQGVVSLPSLPTNIEHITVTNDGVLYHPRGKAI